MQEVYITENLQRSARNPKMPIAFRISNLSSRLLDIKKSMSFELNFHRSLENQS